MPLLPETTLSPPAVPPSMRSMVGEVTASRRKRDDILSPIRFRKGSSGMLSRQLAREADRLMACWCWCCCCCGGTKSGPWSGISHICAAWVRRENQRPMTYEVTRRTEQM